MAWIAGTASAAFAFAYVLIIMVALSHEDGSISNAQTLGIIAGTLANSPKKGVRQIAPDHLKNEVGLIRKTSCYLAGFLGCIA